MTLVVIITVAAEALTEFHEYERRAAKIMAKHGGRIERVVRVPSDAPGLPLKEVHVVTFPNAAAFDAYRGDAELVALLDMRARTVLDTQILTGEDAPVY